MVTAAAAREYLGALVEDARDWCQGRLWWWRAPLLLWMAYVGVRHLGDPLYASLFGGLNLGIHEAGHLVLGWSPRLLAALAGTLFQCAAPAVAAWLFLRQPDYFAVPFCGAWLSDNLYGVATYMADARAMELPLVSPSSGDPDHDWNTLLGAVGLLPLDTTLAFLVRAVAFAVWVASLAGMGWVLWQMARARRHP